MRLFGKVKEVVKQITTSQEDILKIVEQIHNEFDTAADKALKEANEILSKPTEFDHEKLDLMNKLGFNNGANLRERQIVKKEKDDARYKAEIVKKYTDKYPNNKFIFFDQVINICSKYNLVCGEVYSYKGDVPMKNLKEIDAFSPGKEDIYYYEINRLNNFNEERNAFNKYIIVRNQNFIEEFRNKIKLDNTYSIGNTSEISEHQIYIKSKDYYYEYNKVPLYICAPEADMNIRQNQYIENGIIKTNIPDPIVLHYVKEGFLIVSKWGPEANIKELK